MSRARRESRAKAARNKKLAALGVLLALLGVIWGRNLVGSIGSAKARPAALDESGSAAETSGHPTAPAARVELSSPAVPGRNPFALDTTAYPRRPVDTPEDVPAEDPAPEEETIEEALAALQLQGTIQGDIPRAIINGRSFRIGDSVKGFAIKSIGHRRIVVERDGVEAVLEM